MQTTKHKPDRYFPVGEDGVEYKLCGERGFMWYKVNGHWQRSSKTEADLAGKPAGNNKGNPNGNPAKTGKRKESKKTTEAMDTIKLHGSMSKNDMMAITGMNRNKITHVITGLTRCGRLIYNKKTNIYSLPVGVSL